MLIAVHYSSALLEGKASLKGNENTIITPMVPYQFADPVKDRVNDLLADSVVSTGVVVGCIFLS